MLALSNIPCERVDSEDKRSCRIAWLRSSRAEGDCGFEKRSGVRRSLVCSREAMMQLSMLDV